MGLFSRKNISNLEEAKEYLAGLHDEIYEMMDDMVDEKYGFDPELMATPLLDVFAEHASNQTKYKGKQELIKFFMAYTGSSGNDRLKAHYFQLRNLFKAAIAGNLTNGDFQSDECLIPDTERAMHRLAYAAADNMYISLTKVELFNYEEIKELKIEYSDFAVELAEYLEEAFDEFCELLIN